MELRFIKKDGKSILQVNNGGSCEHWEDVPSVVIPRPDDAKKTLAEILNITANVLSAHPGGTIYWKQLASATMADLEKRIDLCKFDHLFDETSKKEKLKAFIRKEWL